jgi:HEAT repeat protein
MKRLSLFIGAILFVPTLAAAQTAPPPPPPPPAAPVALPAVPDLPLLPDLPTRVAPIAMPAPFDLPMPLVAPMPATPVARPVMVAPTMEPGQIVDSDAVRAVIAQTSAEAKAEVDLAGVERALEAAAQAQSQVNSEATRAGLQAAQDKMQAAQDRIRQVEQMDRNFSFTFNQSDGSAYSSGLGSVDAKSYDRAITRFDQTIAQKGTHVDGAYYWKAFSQYKLGKTDEALATIAELRKNFAQSPYLADAKVLEADVKKAAGQPMTLDSSDDDEITLLAAQGLMRTDSKSAIAALDRLLAASKPLSFKRRVLYVLALSDVPDAHATLLAYAKGKGSPDLQTTAIGYLFSSRSSTTSSAELNDIYTSTTDQRVKLAIIQAYINSGNKSALLQIAGWSGQNTDLTVRRSAINGLTSVGSPQDLWQLYAKEENKDLRLQMARAFGSMGAVDQLMQVYKTDKEPEVRQQAVRSLGAMKAEKTGQMLVDIYGAETDKDVRKAVISALGSQNNADGLVACARKETDPTARVDIVRRLVELAPKSKAAMDYLQEIIK